MPFRKKQKRSMSGCCHCRLDDKFDCMRMEMEEFHGLIDDISKQVEMLVKALDAQNEEEEYDDDEVESIEPDEESGEEDVLPELKEEEVEPVESQLEYSKRIRAEKNVAPVFKVPVARKKSRKAH